MQGIGRKTIITTTPNHWSEEECNNFNTQLNAVQYQIEEIAAKVHNITSIKYFQDTKESIEEITTDQLNEVDPDYVKRRNIWLSGDLTDVQYSDLSSIEEKTDRVLYKHYFYICTERMFYNKLAEEFLVIYNEIKDFQNDNIIEITTHDDNYDFTQTEQYDNWRSLLEVWRTGVHERWITYTEKGEMFEYVRTSIYTPIDLIRESNSVLSTATTKLDDLESRVTIIQRIHDNPWQVIAIGLGAGFLSGVGSVIASKIWPSILEIKGFLHVMPIL